jgi:hypothetical protein
MIELERRGCRWVPRSLTIHICSQLQSHENHLESSACSFVILKRVDAVSSNLKHDKAVAET